MKRIQGWFRRVVENEVSLAAGALVVAVIVYVVWGWAIGVDLVTAIKGAHTEASGFIFDVALFGVIFSIFRRRWETRRVIEQAHNEFEAFRKWGETEGVLRKVEIIRRLNREKHPLPNMYDAALSMADLSKADFSRADLNGANLNGANLREADFCGAYLLGANLNGANLHKATLHGATLHGANLHGATLSMANLREADFCGANLNAADLTWAELSVANLHGANLHGANLHWATLHGANLGGADLSEADLSEANLVEATLSEATLSGANLHGADLRVTDGLTCDQLKEARNWESAYRDPELACGADIPKKE